MAKTSDEILEEIKITTVLPSNQALMTDLRILAFCNEEIESKIIPMIQGINQDYLIASEYVPLVANKNTYSIPVRALGRTLRDVKMVDARRDGMRNMRLMNLEDASNSGYSANPSSFYFMGDRIVISPNPPVGTTESLLLYYLQRPGKLVPVSYCGRITGVATDSLTYTTFTLDQLPAAFIAGTVCDFIQGNSGNSLLDLDRPITNIDGTQVTFAYIDPSVGVGDYVAPQYTTPLLQVPEEAFSLVVALAGERVLKAIGDTEGAKDLAKETDEKKKYFSSIMAPRVSGENIRIPRNGLLRGGRGRFSSLLRDPIL